MGNDLGLWTSQLVHRRAVKVNRTLIVTMLIPSLAGCRRDSPARRPSATRPTAVVDSALSLSPLHRGKIPFDVSLVCDSATAIAREALALDVRRQDGVFNDSFSHDRRIGCRLLARGSFRALGDVNDPVDAVMKVFQRHGWYTDARISADGPDGSDVGVRRREMVCIILGRWEGGDDDDTTTHPLTPGGDRFDVIVECAHESVNNADSRVADSIWRVARDAGLDSTYAIAFHIRSPPDFDGDFDGDGNPDAAVLVEERATGKFGVVFINAVSGQAFVAGAGSALKDGTDDFGPIERVEVYHRGSVDLTIADRPDVPFTGDALWIERRDAPGLFVGWQDGAIVVARSAKNTARSSPRH